jgi:preprotein translocase subunit SecE
MEAVAHFQLFTSMAKQLTVVLYVGAMVAIIVSIDFVFFRNRTWD